MATIEVGPLAQHLDEDELAAVEEAFEDADIELTFDEDAESKVIEGDVDSALFDDFFDRIDANNLACDIYVSSDFEEVIEVVGLRIGSAPALLMLLEDMRDDIFEVESDKGDDEDELEPDEDDDDEGLFTHSQADGPPGDIQGDYMRFLWQTMVEAARVCMTDGSAMYVRR